MIREWTPDILLASGPPVYRSLSPDQLYNARQRILSLAAFTQTCIIDHHLLRCDNGIHWLDSLQKETDGRVICAADYMKKKRRFLEAFRSKLYDQYPMNDGWHEKYKAANAVGSSYLSHFGPYLYPETVKP